MGNKQGAKSNNEQNPNKITVPQQKVYWKQSYHVDNGASSNSKIPAELLLIILQFVSTKEYCAVSTVNKTWYNYLAQDEKLWRSKCQAMLDEKYKLRQLPKEQPELSKPGNFNWKQFFGLLQEDLLNCNKAKQFAISQVAYIPCGMDGGIMPTPSRPQVPTAANSVPSWPDHPNSNLNDPVADFGVPHFARAIQELYRLEQTASTILITTAVIRGAMARYNKFMKLKVKYPDAMLVPTIDIELVWMSHLIRPQLYIDYCTNVLQAGNVVPHVLFADESYLALRNAAILSTVDLWQNEYNEPYWLEFPKFEKEKIYECETTDVFYRRKHATYVPLDEHNAKCLPGFVINWQGDSLEKLKYVAYIFTIFFSLTIDEVVRDRTWFGLLQGFVQKQYTDSMHLNHLFSVSMNRYVIKSYERFLYLNAKHPSDSLVHPCFVVDVAWHAHMAYPSAYAADMQLLMGKFINHIPWPNVSESKQVQSYNKSSKLWQDEYKVEMEKDHFYCNDTFYYPMFTEERN